MRGNLCQSQDSRSLHHACHVARSSDSPPRDSSRDAHRQAFPAPDRSGHPSRLRPPPQRRPHAAITAANADNISQLAEIGPLSGPIRGVAWSPDRNVLAAGSIADIYIVDAEHARVSATWHGHTGQIYTLAWSPRTKVLASASGDGTLRLWPPRRPGTSTALSYPNTTPLSVDWSPDGKRLVSGTFEGHVLLWNAETGKHLAEWSGPPKLHPLGGRYPFAVYGASWSPDGSKIVTTRYDGYILIWDMASGTYTALRKTDAQPNTVAWAPDGTRFAVTDDAGVVEVWDAGTQAKVGAFDAMDGNGWAYAVKWSVDGQLLAVSRALGPVQIWDARGGHLLRVLNASQESVWGVAWPPDMKRLASVSDDGTVRLWGVS